MLLAGPTSVGKSTLAKGIERQSGAAVLAVREALAKRLGAPRTRQALQRDGADLENETEGRWLGEEVEKIAGPRVVVVDSARTLNQVRGVRQRFSRVVLVYLAADAKELRRRFESRSDRDFEQGATYSEVASDELEAASSSLREESDIAIDTTTMLPEKALREILKALRALGYTKH